MAKTVQPIAIELGIKGGEKLGALNRSFRDLSKQIKLSDADIIQATKDVAKFAQDAGNSEATIKGQIKAFEGLREQATMGGKAYAALGKEIADLKSNLQGSTSAIDAKKKAILDLANSTGATSKQIQRAIDKLSALRTETKLDSGAFAAFGKDIEGLVAKLNLLDQQAEKAASKTKLLAGGIRATPGSIRAQAQAFKEEAANIQLQIDGIDNLAGKERTLKKNVEERLRLQERLNKLLRSEAQTEFLASVESGRKAVISAANAFNDADVGINSFNKRLQLLDNTFGELPNTTAGLNQRLQELQKQFINTARDGGNYVSVALEIARVQREAAAATQGLGAALVADLASGAAVTSQKNLREAIGQLQSEMNELDVQTAEGSRRYAENANQVRNLETQLRQLGDSYRHVSDMAQQAAAAQGVYANTATARNYLNRAMVRAQEGAGAQLAEAVRAGVAATPLMLPAAGGTTAPGTGAAISGGAVPLRGTRGPLRPIAELPTDLGTIGGRRQRPAGVEAEINDQARRSYISQTEAVRKNNEAKEQAIKIEQGYKAEIDKAVKANNQSINSTTRLRSALDAYRSTLPVTSKEFRNLTDQINKLDRQSEKTSRRMRGRRMSAGQLAQAAGATISGGIFGGPEGFLGGAIGTVLGGTGGAFAGAAIAAQVGGLRRELGGYAEYAAQIEKLKIALKGLTRDQSEFNYALAASQKVTQDFNIPQQESIRGITRLAAAIKGAGGPLTDAEVVFRNVTTAIKATGGSAQDVEGAVTAMVQVFSKGKVSAEELSGQLGERLPGAVTMFAKANNMSLVELQDNLKAGTVGLNELMKFIRSLGDTYGATARKISDSNADAGARLQVVVNDMKTAVGDALIPIGAQLQDAFGKFLQEITPTLVEVLPKIGELFLGIVENLDLIAQAAAAVFAVVVVGKITAIIASIGSLSAAIFTLKLNAIVATKALIGLNGAALLNPYVALAAGAAALGVAIFRAAQEQKRLNTLIREGSVADIDKKLAENRAKIIEIEQRQLEGADPRSAYQAERRAGLAVLPSQASLDQAALKQAQSLEKKLKDARERAINDARQGADLPENLLRPFDYQSPKGDGGDGKGGSSAKEKRERKSQLESINARLTLLDIDKMIRANAREIVEAQADNNFERVKELSLQKLSLASQKESASVQLDYRDALARAAGDENEQMLKAEAAASRDRAIQELRFKLKEDMLDLEQQSRLEQEARTRAAEDEVFALREQLGLVSDQERISRYRTNLEDQGTPNADELTDLYRQTVDPTFAEGISQNIRALKKDLEELLDPVNQVTGAANAIGTAFTDSFMSAITGSATAQEALANFFSNTAKYFLDMAAQIIQKMIVMAILNQVVRVLPGGGGFKFSGGSADAGLNAANLMGGITPFAMGGIVDKPTMFAYANGGVGRFGIMGEAGPEAILPLQRGPGGKLGVQASGGSVGDVVVNVDASGTRAQGDNQSATRLGNVIGAAVQAELIKQKRPGGLLA